MDRKISPSLLSLPSELKFHIAELSSPSTLASLARTHTRCQREAEETLYHTLSIYTGDDDSVKCAETLTTNLEKASYVRVLSVQFQFQFIDYGSDRKVMNCLLKGLINMHSLHDFRLSVYGNECSRAIEEIEKTLCGSHFRLRTLCCNSGFPSLDISRILKNQTELQILGIYNFSPELLTTLQQSHNLLPIVFTLELEPEVKHFTISVFPAFYSVDPYTTHRRLVESLDKDQVFEDAVDNISRLSIYLSDMATIHTVAMGMALSFPVIASLSLLFQHQCEIPSQEVTKTISFFSNLEELRFSFWSEDDPYEVPKIPEDIKNAYVKEWRGVCPKLALVVFTDDSYDLVSINDSST